VCGFSFLYVVLQSHFYSTWDLDSHLTISSSSESLFTHWYTLLLSRSIFKYEYLTHKRSSLVPSFTHLNRIRFPRLSIQAQIVFTQAANLALIPLAGRIRGEKPKRSHKNKTRANPYKGMTSPSTQNLKTLDL